MPVPPYYDWIAHHAYRRPGSSRSTTCRPPDLTYAELHRRTDRLPAGWRHTGIARAIRVALLAPNCAEYFELQFACGRLGAIMLPLNWRLTVPELEYILSDATPKLLVHDKDFAQQAQSWRTPCSRSIPRTRAAPTSARSPRGRRACLRRPDARRHRHDHVHLGHHRHPKGAIITHGMVFWNAVNLGIPRRSRRTPCSS
jgi:fatty-acyl-CoA synthase